MNQKQKNYNLYNNEFVKNEFNILNSKKNLYINKVDNAVNFLINEFDINDLCRNIEYNLNHQFLGCYSFNEKKIVLNLDYLINKIKGISYDEKFINLNVYRIILHEIKHILQYKIALNFSNELSVVYNYELKNTCKFSFMEANADLESTYSVFKILETNDPNFDKIAILTYKTFLKYFSNFDYKDDLDKICFDSSNLNEIDVYLNCLDKNINKTHILDFLKGR